VLAKWYGRWQQHGEAGLMDHSSRPKHTPTAIGDDVVDAIMELRKREKWGAARIAAYLELPSLGRRKPTPHPGRRGYLGLLAHGASSPNSFHGSFERSMSSGAASGSPLEYMENQA
jgi:hypothetical protein